MGTWGPGAFENDAALDFVGEQTSRLVQVVTDYLDAARAHEGLDEALAALEVLSVLVKYTPTAPPTPAELTRWKPLLLSRVVTHGGADAAFVKVQRKAVEKTLDRLLGAAQSFHRGDGVASTQLTRLLERQARSARSQPFTVNFADLITWAFPYGDDVSRLWRESKSGAHLLVVARVLGVSAATLHAIETEVVRQAAAQLPADAPPLHDAQALTAWATAAVDQRVRELLPLAAIARGAATVACAPDSSPLGLGMHEILEAERLRAAVAAERTGMSWVEAMTVLTAPGWTSLRALDERFAALVRARIPAPVLPPIT